MTTILSLARRPGPPLDLLTAEEERELAMRRDAGDRDARNELVERNLRLAFRAAHLCSKDRGSLSFDDLATHAVIGLIRAADKFDPSRGTRFSTCAGRWIMQALAIGIEAEAHMVRVPRHMHLAISRIAQGLRPIVDHGGTDALVSAARRALTARPSGCSGSGFLADLPAPEDDDPESEGLAPDSATLARLAAALDSLPDRSARVIRLLYGIDCEPSNQADVARLLGMTKQNVQHVKLRALELIREHMAGTPRWATDRRARADEARRLAAEGVPAAEIGRRLGISPATAWRIMSGRSWKGESPAQGPEIQPDAQSVRLTG